ncbi:DUF4998 domain-containing protein [Bacteroides salyersiae]|jgi:hypothetical protein|uniref:DUF4998 domain-containing protein n=1 Tax=Bacteroides salyersiae TaxID=291644 RepID=UPI001C8C3A4E|nr:DUF4998 domain-containing protein [Bacteroides salyersiae]
MKKINYILIAAVSALCACSDMNSLHDKYLEDGETIYLARFDSLKIHPGRERVKVFYWLSDPKVKTTTAKWNMDKESGEYEVHKTTPDAPGSFIIEGLDEGSYSFNFYNNNAEHDLHSIKYSITAISYGDAYQNAIINTSPTDFTYNQTTDKYSFMIKTKYENAIAYDICYTKIDGTKVTDLRYYVADLYKEEKMVLPIVLEGGDATMEIQLRTVYHPEPDCIDEFVTEYDEFLLENPKLTL